MYADDLVLLSESATSSKMFGKNTLLNGGSDTKQRQNKNTYLSKIWLKTFFNFGDMTIEITETYKYLGISVIHTGHFKINQNLIKKKGLHQSGTMSQLQHVFLNKNINQLQHIC